MGLCEVWFDKSRWLVANCLEIKYLQNKKAGFTGPEEKSFKASEDWYL